jgi:xanthine dehydrogenase YagR molybdenum-binding subunit
VIALGDGVERVDARAKVQGAARYSAEHERPGLLHAVMVTATIANGRITTIDLAAARAVPGFVDALTHENAPRLNGAVTGRPGLDKNLLLLQDDRIRYDRQPVAVVLAESLLAAQRAAAALRVTYDVEAPLARMDDPAARPARPTQTMHGDPPEIERGDAAAAFAHADVVLAATYTTPMENHNPIEPHASIAEWDGDRLTIHDATQGVFEERRKLADVFGIPAENVRVLSPFVGGAFGNKGSVWSHQVLAAAAARHSGRPVKLVLARDQMFATTGHRPQTVQHIRLGADRAGTIAALQHHVTSDTSTFDVYVESAGEYSSTAYAVPNVDIRHRVLPLNIGTPTFMRAPGEATGTYALESALDELSYALGIDPIDLRLRNHADDDPSNGKPFSSKHLRECYARGAERIGWAQRPPQPRSMRAGRELIGIGMAGGSYPSQIFNASAEITMDAGGDVIVRSGTHELGQGSYTALAQVAADELGIPLARVRMELGDTRFPSAMNSGGSTTVASVGSAIALAAREIKRKLGGSTAAPGREIQARADFSAPHKRDGYSSASFGAQFAEVAVDVDFGTIRVRRLFGVFDLGRVVNRRLAYAQCIGGMTMGVGMALLEATHRDPGTARVMNASLGDYHVPVNTDIGEIDAEMIAVYDDIVNEIGTKPVGEIGICGAAAAIANAVYHATGRRVRDLPIRSRDLRSSSRATSGPPMMSGPPMIRLPAIPRQCWE